MPKKQQHGRMERKREVPEEVFMLGPIRVARKGRFVEMRNLISPEDHAQFIKMAASSFERVLKDIYKVRDEIGSIVTALDPLELLSRAYWEYVRRMLPFEAESEIGPESAGFVFSLEYLQSLIVSCKAQGPVANLTEETWSLLVDKLTNIHRACVLDYHLANTAKRMRDGVFDEEDDELYFLLTTFWLGVRGKRYVQHEIEHLTSVLSPHDRILKKLFGVTGAQIAEASHALIWRLISGPDVLREMLDFQDTVLGELRKRLGDSDKPPETDEEFRVFVDKTVRDLGLDETRRDIFGRMFGPNLFDVSIATGLPASFLNHFALAPGEYDDFMKDGKYPGTPLQRLPVHSRPLLKIEGQFYAFSPYLWTDNLYRNVQEVVLRLKPSYTEKWNSIQRSVSEELAFTILEAMLPGAEIVRNVYYETRNEDGSTTWNECDGIVIYDRFLLIVECKGAKPSTKPPAQNIDSHFEKIRGTISEGAEQGRRFLKSLQQSKTVRLYDEKHNLLKVCNVDEYDETIICVVLLEQITDISPIIQLYKRLNLNPHDDPVWAVSLDDLRVCRDIFRGPIEFCHFLTERLKAFANTDLRLFDELDHLGLYLAMNLYSQAARNLPKNTRLSWHGYRDPIDKYFHQLLVDPKTARPPGQAMDELFQEMLRKLEESRGPGFVRAGCFLLSFSPKGRNNITAAIRQAIALQREDGRIRPFTIVEESSILSVVVFGSHMKLGRNFDCDIYTMTNMVISGASEALSLKIFTDNAKEVKKVEFKCFTPHSITPEMVATIRENVDRLSEERLQRVLADRKRKKIGRNELCPCGSAIKFKKCCSLKIH